ncbi:MAG: hypothetical protein GY853_08580 [PVC group bacterium]|nr:hypothetical protein [PVC group bacterium]
MRSQQEKFYKLVQVPRRNTAVIIGSGSADILSGLKEEYKQVDIVSHDKLDLKDCSIDLVVFNGSLVDVFDKMGDLKKVKDALTSGGKVALAVKNKWCLNNWGKADYNYCGYKKLLKNAGYENINVFLVYPNYVSPQAIYSLDKPALNEFYRKYHSQNKFKKIIKFFSDTFKMKYLMAFFEKSFYIVAEKGR